MGNGEGSTRWKERERVKDEFKGGYELEGYHPMTPKARPA
jgi:hypothetical protein